MFPPVPNVAVGDLVILRYDVEWMGIGGMSGEIGVVTEIYNKTIETNFFNCQIVLGDGVRIDVWYGEIEKLDDG